MVLIVSLRRNASVVMTKPGGTGMPFKYKVFRLFALLPINTWLSIFGVDCQNGLISISELYVMMSLMSFGSRVASMVLNEVKIRPMKLSSGCIRNASESMSRWNSSDFLLIRATISRSLSLFSASKSCGITTFSGYS